MACVFNTSDGWGLVRASNTQPVLVMRFEARTNERLLEIRHEMESWLRERKASIPRLALDTESFMIPGDRDAP